VILSYCVIKVSMYSLDSDAHNIN